MKNKIYDFNQICDKVKQLDSEIIFAGVINQRGRLIAGGIKEGIKSFASEKDNDILFMELALRVKMRKEFDKQLGGVNFAMASRGRSMEMSIPIDDEILYIIGEPSVNYAKIPNAVFEIIKGWKVIYVIYRGK